MITFLAAGGNASPQWLPVVVGAIVALGGGTGVTALLRARPERQQILVNAAEGAVVIQSSVLREVQADRDAIKRQVAELTRQVSAVTLRNAELTQQVQDVTDRNEELTRENLDLRTRVKHLEDVSDGPVTGPHQPVT